MEYLNLNFKVTADGKLDRESFTNQVPNLPEPRRAPITKSMEACATASGIIY